MMERERVAEEGELAVPGCLVPTQGLSRSEIVIGMTAVVMGKGWQSEHEVGQNSLASLTAFA